jgi:hypothetical protein
MQRMNVVTKIVEEGCDSQREILVQLNPHRTCGIAETGKSSSAEAAAKAIAA